MTLIKPTITSSRHPSSRTEPTSATRAPFISRHRLRIVLGLLWMLDGALQLQSFMFSPGFAKSIIAPSATGQPTFVSAPVEWNARLIGSHPVLFNASFASVQLLLGVGFLFRRTARGAVVASVAWALGVWYLGEGLGGLAGGHVTGLLGAPGAAFLYAVLALAAWPRSQSNSDSVAQETARPPGWTVVAWAVLWVSLAALSLLPGNGSAHSVSDQLSMNASAAPSWLAGIDRVTATVVRVGGTGSVVVLAAGESAIGLCALGRTRIRAAALWAGLVLTFCFWAAGQSFGELFSGQATDPSTGPLVILLGLTAFAAAGSLRRTQAAEAWQGFSWHASPCPRFVKVPGGPADQENLGQNLR